MKGVILAAGEGTRLEGVSNVGHKALVKLGGLGLIERLILAFKAQSITEIIIVIGYNGDVLMDHLGGGERYGAKIEYVSNQEWRRGNGSSLYAAKTALGGEKFLLSMADHWYEPRLLGGVLGSPMQDVKCVLCTDKNIRNISDLEDATKAYIDESGLVKGIGKGLEKYNAVDTGVFILTSEIFDALEESSSKGDYSLTGGVSVLVQREKLLSHDIGGVMWQDIDSKEDLAEAERRLFSSLRGEGDGLVAKHINRRLSIHITKALSKYNVSPNQVSIFAFLISLASGLLFTMGPLLASMVAGVLAQLSSVIDGTDGEVARLKFLSTRRGQYMDSILDRYGDCAILVGMTYYSFVSIQEPWVILVALLALFGSGMSMMSKDVFFRVFQRRFPSELDRPARFLLAGRDGRLLIIFLGGLTGQILPTLVLLALTTNLLAAYRLIAVRRLQG